jgi:hypothetical protein
MKIKRTTWLPWILCAVVVGAASFSLMPTLDGRRVHADIFDFATAVLDALLGVAFGVVGALILSRQARNRIGWLLMVIALPITVGGTLLVYLAQAMSPAAAPTLLTYLLMWLNGWTWWLLIGPLLLILLLFPTGQWLSPRWRWVAGLIALLFLTFIGVLTLSPEWQDSASGNTLPNPLGVNVLPTDFTFEMIETPWFITLVSTAALCVLSVLIRYRRSGVVEREQLKWFLSACAFFIAAYATGGFSSIGEDRPNWAGVWLNLAFILLPVSIGIAILRYRLFDIDIIIRRTVTYSILTGLLALIYFGGVVLVQQLTRSITASSDLAIAVSTLIIAALFFPLRRRVQNAIDRRFYRRKYDAAKTLAAFGVTVRDEVELEKLTSELLNVVSETMQPEHISLWLKPTDVQRQRTS